MSEPADRPEPPDRPLAPGMRVRLAVLPPYVKTADPMPMLRSPEVLSLGEVGTVLDRRPGGFWAVRFERGAYLLAADCLDPADEPTA